MILKVFGIKLFKNAFVCPVIVVCNKFPETFKMFCRCFLTAWLNDSVVDWMTDWLTYSLTLKLFAARLFWTVHNKLHNMKALVILSHHDHHFSHLLVFMKKNELLCSSGVFSQERTPHSSPFQHRGSYRDLCPNFWEYPVVPP